MTNTNDRSKVLIAFLLGVCVALGVALVLNTGQGLPRAYAQAASGQGGVFAVTGTGTTQQGKDVLFVVDTASQHLCVYEYNGGNLKMGAVRNMEFDFQIPTEYQLNKRKQEPEVTVIRGAVEKSGKKGK
ncbi:MAG: hypothetical protein AB7N76_16395 [Planctomycetota bacterium]